MAAKSTRRPGKSTPSAAAGGKGAASKKTRAPARRSNTAAKGGSPARSGEAFPIVGIGTSAGGIESLMALLKHLPVSTGMAFVIVQHLDPTHASRLSELLARGTDMPVHEITDGMAVKRDGVYVIPPNYDLTFKRHTLKLHERQEGDTRVHLSIDRFFASLAAEHKENAIGVVLSGTGRDGTAGLGAIKEAGGVTFAEAESSARYFAMPSSAMTAGVVDAVVTPQELAAKLPGIARHPLVRSGATAKPQAPPFPDSADDFSKILFLLRQHCGVDFSQYKHSTLQRRLARRMPLCRAGTLAEYVEILRKNPEEVNALFHDILIHVTGFFRDGRVFAVLKKKILPKIIKTRQELGGEMRVWVPGCSTGEEVYSVAMLLVEAVRSDPPHPKVQVFGTDLSEAILSRARLGIYPESIAKDVSPDRLRRFFVKVKDGYQINREIRDMCIFARQNVCDDPPFSRLDLITCRNVLIYLGPALQRKVVPIFHYALNPGGCLVLGSSETIGGHADLFALLDKRNNVYVKKAASLRATALEFKSGNFSPSASGPAHLHPTMKQPPEPDLFLDLQRRSDQIVISAFGPPGVIIDGSMHVVQFRGLTGPFFEHQPGTATLGLLQMVRASLVLDLRTALHKAMKEHTPVRKDGAFVKYNGHTASVSLHVVPFRVEPYEEYWYLVLFQETAMAEAGGAARGARDKRRLPKKEMTQLRAELASTRESFQVIIGEREAVHEKLKNASEEIQCANEELQSTNEELETAMEELQSANEELTTVNEELDTRNAELAQVNDDLNNLLVSINIPIIIVDSTLVVRRVNPLARNLFNLLSGDVGRRIGDIKPKLDIPDLDQMIREVIDSHTEQEREVRDRKGHIFSLRMRPYRTTDSKIDGAVITLVDIEEIKRLADIQIARAARTGQAEPASPPPPG